MGQDSVHRRPVAVVLVGAAAVLVAAAHAQPGIPLAALTVPGDDLPPACALTRDPAESTRAGAQAPRPAPWIGSDPSRLAAIRQAITGPLPVPDAAPIDRPERFWLELAAGVEEGYTASYATGAKRPAVIVMALRYASGHIDEPVPGRRSGTRREYRLVAGNVVAVARGPEGACFDAVARHLQSLEP
jgi:hypothetical protein